LPFSLILSLNAFVVELKLKLLMCNNLLRHSWAVHSIGSFGSQLELIDLIAFDGSFPEIHIE